MLNTKKIMLEKHEDEMIETMLSLAEKNKMTISNIREVTDKVISVMESNATLELGDPKQAILESPIIQN